MDWLATALDTVCPKINDLIKKYNEGESRSKKEALGDMIVQLLLDSKLAYAERRPNEGVWVHPQNRFGAGLDTTDVHALLHLIVTEKGWSWAACAKARAIEMNPSGDVHKRQLEFNQKLSSAADGFLAPVDPHDRAILSIACSHTVAGLRAVNAGCKTVKEDMAVDGMLNKEKVMDISPSLREPLQTGLPWVVIRFQVEERCPDIAGFLQMAGNGDHGTARVQTKTQTLLQIHAFARTWVSMHGKAADWKQIVMGMQQKSPSMKDEMSDMAEFTRSWSGGETACHLYELDKFAKTLSSRRDIKAKDLLLMSKVKLQQSPEWIMAAAKAMLASPVEFTVGGVSKLLQKGDIDAMTGCKKELVSDAVDKIRMAKTWLFSNIAVVLGDDTATKLMNDFEIRLVMAVHCKRCKTRTTFKTVHEVCVKLVDDVLKVAPLVSDAPFDMPARATTSTPPHAFPSINEKLAVKGFDVGSRVKHGDATEWTIVDMGTTVRLQAIEQGADGREMSMQQLDDEYVVVKEEPDVRFNPKDFVAANVHPDMIIDQHKSNCKLALQSSFKQSSNVIVQVKPKRGVVAAGAHVRGQLTLVPLTTNVVITDGPCPSNSCSLGVVGKHPVSQQELTAYALARAETPFIKPTHPFLVPFWFVNSTPDSAKVNMVPATKTCKIDVDDSATTVSITVLTNDRAIEDGEELFISEEIKKCVKVEIKNCVTVPSGDSCACMIKYEAERAGVQ